MSHVGNASRVISEPSSGGVESHYFPRFEKNNRVREGFARRCKPQLIYSYVLSALCVRRK